MFGFASLHCALLDKVFKILSSSFLPLQGCNTMILIDPHDIDKRFMFCNSNFITTYAIIHQTFDFLD